MVNSVATLQTIEHWLNDAVRDGADFLIVACDTFNYNDYPVPVNRSEFWEKHGQFDGKHMQRIMEVYDLSINLQSQLSERRAMHCPP